MIQLSFAKKRILVTGAASGLGEAFTLTLVKSGASVLAADTNESALRSLTEKSNNLGGSVLGVVLDVTDREACRQLSNEFLAHPIDAIINSAGILLASEVHFKNVGNTWDRMLAVNTTGTFNVTTEFFPHLQKSRGTVLNLSSAAATTGRNRNVAYQASKAAISQLTRGWAVEFAEYGIRVNALAPGPIETPMTAPTRDDPDLNRRTLSVVPLKRYGTPDEVAAAGLFLLSSFASYITGTVLTVDGGAGAN